MTQSGATEVYPPQHVMNTFTTSASVALRSATPKQLGPAWDNGWLVGETVFSHTGDFGTFSARVRDRLTDKFSVEGARVAKPLRSTDGRYNVAGWIASAYSAGSPAKRVDETALVALRLEEALEKAEVALPNAGTAQQREDVFAQAEKMAWAETGEAYRALDLSPGELTLGHADLLASVLYNGAQAPVITSIVPTAALRPRGYTAALVVVDGLIQEAVDEGICSRFGHIKHFDQLLLRAAAYRRYVNNLHPHSKTNVRSRIERVENLLMSRANGNM